MRVIRGRLHATPARRLRDTYLSTAARLDVLIKRLLRDVLGCNVAQAGSRLMSDFAGVFRWLRFLILMPLNQAVIACAFGSRARWRHWPACFSGSISV